MTHRNDYFVEAPGLRTMTTWVVASTTTSVLPSSLATATCTTLPPSGFTVIGTSSF
jgi:hypothetical protein